MSSVDVQAPLSASVGELVQQRLSERDRWNLALVQRAEVWDELRMRHLLDSLLADYPIGAILLSTVRGENRELRLDADGARVEAEAADGSWQILDGQQRINALFSIFTDQGRYGRFLLDMHMSRPEPAPAQGRSAKERSIPHIRHLRHDQDEIDGRERFVDLSGWARWAASHSGLPELDVSASSVAAQLVALDPEFSGELSVEEAAVAADNLGRLIRAWTKQSVPILRAELDSPLDVLEVFTRINLGGVDVAGADVYFAGVKTFWREAESRVDQVLDEAPVLRNRIGALRFLSRLASRSLGYGDVIPLTVDRLAGKKGELLRAALAELTEPGSPARLRLGAFVSWYTSASALGYVLHQVTPELWDDVLAWAVTSPRTDTEWYESNASTIDAYLLGATLFGYRAVMGDAFRRIAFHEALDAGSRGLTFPLEDILGVTRAKTRLRGSRGRAVRSMATPEDLEALARRNGWLLTALAQRIPYDWSEEDQFDWDHIFPQAQSHRMWSPGDAGRRRHHPDRHLVNSTGNFWALNSSANRSLQDTVGRAKFEQLLSWLRQGDGWKIWPEDRWSITPEEIERFILVDEKLNGDPISIDEGMRIFKETVSTRSQRLLDAAIERFPEVIRFADDADAPAHDAAPKKHDYRDALGLQIGDATLAAIEQPEARDRLRTRTRILSSRIVDQLEADDLLFESWMWEPSGRGTRELAFAAFQLTGGNCVELMLKWQQPGGAFIEFKAYPNRRKPSKPDQYPEFSEIPMGVDWFDHDDVIVAAFLEKAREVEQRYPR